MRLRSVHGAVLAGVVGVGIFTGVLLSKASGDGADNSALPEFESFGKHIAGECTRFWYFDHAGAASGGLSLEWLAAAFAPEADPDGEQLLLLIAAQDWNQKNLRGGAVVVPLDLHGEEVATVPRTAIARVLSIGDRAGGLRLLTPSRELDSRVKHGLKLSLAYLEDGSREGEGFGWMLGFRAPDRDPFPAGVPNLQAQCREPAFTIAGGSLTRMFGDESGDVYRFSLDGVAYAVSGWESEGLTSKEVAEMLDGR